MENLDQEHRVHPIIYDVAVSLDGFISGGAGDVSQFAHKGAVVDDYVSRLGGYKMAVMGRETYEFGYDFGLEPGKNPYPHMKTIVFSNTLRVPADSDISVRKRATPNEIRRLVSEADGPVYLCGGGAFAGWMLEHGLIDRVILKRAPTVLGRGTPLFGATTRPAAMSRVDTKVYDNGYLLEVFEVR